LKSFRKILMYRVTLKSGESRLAKGQHNGLKECNYCKELKD